MQTATPAANNKNSFFNNNSISNNNYPNRSYISTPVSPAFQTAPELFKSIYNDTQSNYISQFNYYGKYRF